MIGRIIWRILLEPKLHLTYKCLSEDKVDCNVLKLVYLFLDSNYLNSRNGFKICVSVLEIGHLSGNRSSDQIFNFIISLRNLFLQELHREYYYHYKDSSNYYCNNIGKVWSIRISQKKFPIIWHTHQDNSHQKDYGQWAHCCREEPIYDCVLQLFVGADIFVLSYFLPDADDIALESNGNLSFILFFLPELLIHSNFEIWVFFLCDHAQK